MPLPKPSKVISKRFKKPKPPYPLMKTPPSTPTPSNDQPLPRRKLWPDTHHRKWRIRVVCTDPDATDDSSADELDTPPTSRKRLIHETFLSLPPPSSLPQPSMADSSLRPQRRRQSANSDTLTMQSRKLCCNSCGSDAILQGMDTLLDAASEACIVRTGPGPPHNWAVMPPESEITPVEEEFVRFLSEFVADIGEKYAWEAGHDELAMPQEDEIADMLNLELDSEALTWINSLQRLP